MIILIPLIYMITYYQVGVGWKIFQIHVLYIVEPHEKWTAVYS